MAGLADLILPTKTIPIPGGEITVRGISLNDLTGILSVHAEALSSAFERVQAMAQNKAIDTDDTTNVIRTVAQSVPELVSVIIATAADEPALMEIAARIPFAAQVRILEAVFFLTFNSEEELKNLAETVVRAVTGAKSLRVVQLPG